MSQVREIIVRFEHRSDGGLRAWCDELPGFALSHADARAVLNDVEPVLVGILSTAGEQPASLNLMRDELNSEAPRRVFGLAAYARRPWGLEHL